MTDEMADVTPRGYWSASERADFEYDRRRLARRYLAVAGGFLVVAMLSLAMPGCQTVEGSDINNLRPGGAMAVGPMLVQLSNLGTLWGPSSLELDNVTLFVVDAGWLLVLAGPFVAFAAIAAGPPMWTRYLDVAFLTLLAPWALIIECHGDFLFGMYVMATAFTGEMVTMAMACRTGRRLAVRDRLVGWRPLTAAPSLRSRVSKKKIIDRHIFGSREENTICSRWFPASPTGTRRSRLGE